MEFPNLEQIRTRDDCAKYFTLIISQMLVYITKSVSDTKCYDMFDELRTKFLKVRDVFITNEAILENTGPILLQWEKQIVSRNDEFFHRADINCLLDPQHFSKVQSVVKLDDSLRDRFYAGTTDKVRKKILEALNYLIIIYAKFVVMRPSK
jgi:hypothetical protein